ncbi:MAG: 30S ribosomal protein S8 [Planctomycetes bacterium]|nr:30S ribosomal protein S8 [Planctomycetota bacterium]
MSMTDPIADLLTRIRNAISTGKKSVKVPYSNLKKNVLRVLKEQGYILDYVPEMEGRKGVLRVELKYGPDGELVLQKIQRVSRPGRRVYKGADEVPSVLDGLGISVLSTSRGVLSNIEAKKLRVGGEVLCEVW